MDEKETFWIIEEVEIPVTRKVTKIITFASRRHPREGEHPVKCQCGLWFATEKDLDEHIKRRKASFKAIKREPNPVRVDFYRHGRMKK